MPLLMIRRSKLCYTASGIITPVGGRPVVKIVLYSMWYHHTLQMAVPVHRTATYRFDDTRCGIIQF